MHPITVSIITIAVLSSVTFVVLFGDLPNYRGSYVHRFRTRLVNTYDVTVRFLGTVDNRCFNGMLRKVFVEEMYVCYKWIPPVFYMALLIGSLWQFEQYCYPRITDPNVHLIMIIIFINLSSFLMATFIDLGDLSRLPSEELMKKYPYDELIFFNHSLYGNGSKNYCKTCNLLKIPRSKHCSVCNKCIVLFDHHCLWLNNCVGYYNYKWFLSFLASFIWMLIYGGILTYSVLSRDMIPNGERNQWQNWYDLISKTSILNERTGILFLICISLPWLIIWFSFEHLQFLYLGMTTNESSKWDFVRYLIDEGALYDYNGDFYLIRDFDGVFYRLGDDSLKFEVEDLRKLTKINDMQKELSNVYDLGIWGNLKQRIIG